MPANSRWDLIYLLKG